MNKLQNKLSIVSSFLHEFSLDVFGVAETWFLPSVDNSFVYISGYSFFRRDTDSNVPKHGVCFYQGCF